MNKRSEYREFCRLMAQGMNFEENACIFGAAIQNNDGESLNITLHYNGSDCNVRAIMHSLIENYLSNIKDNQDAAFERDYLLAAFAEDEQRRMEAQ